ncbi:MAG TPA: HD domain-containing phosphohydrolase [Thermodesulfovibrionales bacterium]|nr:HD domain-containing phosphohydrolase [Thermodesulfovibrionales bacterium]
MEVNRYKDDLTATVQELSHAYEELSLLYRVSGMFASLSIDDICSRMLDEAIDSLGVRTAAVLFLDEKKNVLHTKTSRGTWDNARAFTSDTKVLWKSIQTRKPSAFCRIADTAYRDDIAGVRSLLVCPIQGKAKTIGAIVVADKEGDQEFFSYDTKLLMAICSQAGLSVENAMLYNELEELLVGAIKSLVKALEATSYWTAGHTERVTEYSLAIGQHLDLPGGVLEKLKICSLLHDIGKIATPKEILNKDERLTEAEWIEIRKHPGIGAEILGEMQQFNEVILGIKYHHEHWDGRKSIFGLKREEIPLLSRILSVADTFDALTSDRPYRAKRRREEAIEEIRRCSGSQFDPAVVEAFLRWTNGSTRQHPVP